MLVLRNSHPTPAWLDRFFDSDTCDLANNTFSTTNTTLPAVNIKEDESAFKVELAAPGIDKEDFKIELNANALKVSSEKKVESETAEGEFFTKREFSYQSFSRAFTLPQTADSDRIEANYEKGILTVTIPKKEDAKPKPARTIDIL
ncbi:MAG: Hsp20/alpha crystallin family protein [Paludibacter sp.]|jgi:HSP20 family protein|nr:Hsp20/alpha crystallin family protein [Paludibacter sp.]